MSRQCERCGLRGSAVTLYFAALAVLAWSVPAAAQVRPDVDRLLGTLNAAPSNEAPRIRQSPSGDVLFLGAPTGAYFRSAGAPGTPEETARSFMREHSLAFGITPYSVELLTKNVRTSGRRSHLLFTQLYKKIPVYGSGIRVQVGPQGRVETVLSDIMRDTTALDFGGVSVEPTLERADGEELAVIEVEAEYNASGLGVEAGTELMIFAPEVLDLKGDPRLVWSIVVSQEPRGFIREQVFVDAHSGETVLHFTLIHTFKNRLVYDSNNTFADPGTLTRTEGSPPSGITEVDLAYTYLGDTYDFYLNEHGRDSLDDAGFTLSATVRFCIDGAPCPFANAFWDGSRVFFGDGFAAADDVVAHELTHGVTSSTSNLIYFSQSGALNESFSDIWGEFVDLTNSGGTDTPAVRWLMGEDVPGFGAIRDMKDPTTFGDPDRQCSPFYFTGSGDNQGVHINSGVINKLCYLLTDGATFNGQSVTGIGISLVADLFYECQTNLLTPSSNFTDFYNAFTTAALNLGLSPSDRTNIENAMLATELSTASPCVTPPDNDECANAIPIAPGETIQSSSRFSTGTDITSCTGGDSNDVWYSLIPSVTDFYTISLCGSTYDTALAVFQGCGGAELACNDDSCGLQSQVSVALTSGQTYLIRVSGWMGSTGVFSLFVSGPGGLVPPDNDECVNAIPIAPGETIQGSSRLSTGTDITSCTFGDSNDVWYSLIPSVTDLYTISLCGSTYDTALAVFQGCGGAELACNDDSCGLQSQVSVALTSGQTYMIRVSGYDGATGDFSLFVNDPGGAPSSDCGEIENSGFESGTFSSWTPVTGVGLELEAWNVAQAGSGWFGNGVPKDGVKFAENGFDGDAGLTYDIYQEVVIPAAATTAVFSWSDRIQWDMLTFCFGCTLSRTYEVTVQPQGGGSPIATLYTDTLAPSTVGDTGYIDHVVDLLQVAPSIAGTTVRVNWHQLIPESFTGPAQFNLDAVCLTIDGGGPDPRPGGVIPGMSFPMDSDPGWTTEGDWAFGVPQGGGNANGDPTSGTTGSNVYGYNLSGDYPNDLPETRLTTPPFDFSPYSGVTLKFWRWLGVESSLYDHASVLVSNDGSTWTTVWENPDVGMSDSSWVEQTFDISAIADGQPNVRVRWVMGATDFVVTYPGWNIDDVSFEGVQEPMSEVWVDFDFDGAERGTVSQPFSTLAAAFDIVTSGGTIKIKGDSTVRYTLETPLMDQPLQVEAIGGTVRIGGSFPARVNEESRKHRSAAGAAVKEP